MNLVRWRIAAPTLLAIAAAAALSGRPAHAVTLTLVSESTPWAGVTWRHYTTSSPKTNTWVALVDLCTSHVHVDSRKPPSALQSTGAFAGAVGAQLATNGDFYKTGPVRVYGDAVGGGIRWPAVQTGTDPQYASEWYYQDYGWIAFGHDWVEHSHTGLVKKAAAANGVTSGWSPTTVTTDLPTGTLALVSGFPELVIEGATVTCADPTASTCFPDRSDMRARHPRTAMGLSEDRQTFILAVVDGRTTASAGMYGTELAELMAKLGAWVAFNLDGGGSSEMWVEGEGYVNDVGGNNNGGGARSVANHWAVFAGSASGLPARAGSCLEATPCGVIGPGGGVIDNDDPCFRVFGPAQYWRTEPVGHGGSLRWTNAFQSDFPGNWAWWQMTFAEAGTYRLEVYGHPDFAVYAATEYVLTHAGGQETTVVVDQSQADGWLSLGEFGFDAGGRQLLRVLDDVDGAVAANQHICADAIRLTRVGPWCGDGQCDGGESCGGCPADCGPCPSCGDGSCDAGEGCESCAVDCGPCAGCGDGSCDADEGCGSCPADCGACGGCGDGTCEGGPENCFSCPEDCGACVVCGDGVCMPQEGCEACPVDCGPCGGAGPDAGSGGGGADAQPTSSDAHPAGAEADTGGPGDVAGSGGGGGGVGADGGCGAAPAGPSALLAVLLVAWAWRRRAARRRARR